MGLFGKVANLFTPDYERAARYRCRTCAREFVYDAGLEDPDCPYCDSEDIDRLETT